MKNIKLEAGKYYRTRDGRKVFIIGCNPFDTDGFMGFPFGGFVEGADGDKLEWWSESGAFGVREDNLDIVAEWKEPKRITGWVVIRRVENVQWPAPVFYKAKEEAQRAEHAVGVLFVDMLEGEGLEEVA